MNRRGFLKSIVNLVGAGALAPLAPLAIKKRGWWSTKPSPKIIEARVAAVLTEFPRIPEEHFLFLRYLDEQMQRQLGVSDLIGLRKVKREQA